MKTHLCDVCLADENPKLTIAKFKYGYRNGTKIGLCIAHKKFKTTLEELSKVALKAYDGLSKFE